MFLCTLLIPSHILRSKMMTIRAFNTEVALVRDQVSQKDIGLSRLVFWREALNKLFQSKKDRADRSRVHRQPTVMELSRVVFEDDVSKKWFMNLLDGRERLMSDAPFSDLNDLETYSDQTVTPILYLGFEILGLKNIAQDHAASHLGKAIGLANFIRSIPHNAQSRRVLVPNALMAKHTLSQEDFIRKKNSDKIKELVYEVASQAHVHYEKAKAMKSQVDKSALPLFLAGVPTSTYLKRLQRVSFDPFHTSLTRRYGLLPWHLYYKKFTKTHY